MGRGGIGIIYEADAHLFDPRRLQRFQREAQPGCVSPRGECTIHEVIVLLGKGSHMKAAIIDRGRGPEIPGSRITVYDVLAEMQAGATPEELACWYQL